MKHIYSGWKRREKGDRGTNLKIILVVLKEIKRLQFGTW